MQHLQGYALPTGETIDLHAADGRWALIRSQAELVAEG